MKTLLLAAPLFHFLLSTSAFCQGSLTPPGAPAPTMQTLDQLGAKTDEANTKLNQVNAKADTINARSEKRIPISSLPFTIGQPGSYYLTGSLEFSAASADAIIIAVSNVTLDLMGFTLSSTSAVTGSAIRTNGGVNGIEIRNGVIAGNTTVTISGTAPTETWTVAAAGFNTGINAANTTHSHISNLRISGCRQNGMAIGTGAVVDHVTATQNGLSGIVAISGRVANSTSFSNRGHGIQSGSGAVMNCVVSANAGDGINAESGGVTNSISRNNGRNGISCVAGVIAFCTAAGNNRTNVGTTDFLATGSTRTGNYPSP